MTGQQKKMVRYALDRIFERSGSDRAQRHDDKVDEFIRELEKIFPTYSTVSADPLGADRAARKLPPGGYNLIGGISENFHPEDH